jgi:hypothetical protein
MPSFCAIWHPLLNNEDRKLMRLAWLTGVGDQPGKMKSLSTTLEESPEGSSLRRLDVEAVANGAATLAPRVALLFGSTSPDLGTDDIRQLYHAVVAAPPHDSATVARLDSLSRAVMPVPRGLTPGQEGSVLVSRLQNIGRLSVDEADLLREP